jgi:predicted nucleotidyltransferase
MKSISLDISGKVEQTFVEAISKFQEILDLEKIKFMLVGATARDFLMEYVFDTIAPRKTTDVDLGIQIKSWAEFEKLDNALVGSGMFVKGKDKQSYFYNDIPIDVIPFGGISGKTGTISWPPQNDIVLNVIGFNDVFEKSICLVLNKRPYLKVSAPTVAGLAVLKIFAWKQGFPNRTKDALDLRFLMENYMFAGNMDRLYEQELPVLEKFDFDVGNASIYLLGRDMARICGTKALKELLKITQNETTDYSNFDLTIQMMAPLDDFENTLNFVKILSDGARSQ